MRHRLRMILASLGLAPVLALASAPGTVDSYRLKVDFHRAKITNCRTQVRVENNEWYQLCGTGAIGSNVANQLRIHVEKKSANQFLISGRVEEVLPDGKIRQISNPRIMALAGEESSIEVGEGDEIIMSLKVKVEAE